MSFLNTLEDHHGKNNRFLRSTIFIITWNVQDVTASFLESLPELRVIDNHCEEFSINIAVCITGAL